MYLFTAFVCKKSNNFYELDALLCGAALISLIGLCSFVREVKKRLKAISHL